MLILTLHASSRLVPIVEKMLFRPYQPLGNAIHRLVLVKCHLFASFWFNTGFGLLCQGIAMEVSRNIGSGNALYLKSNFC